MKVISILQPWASLVVAGHKKIETRSWNTKYRGEILIHASAGKKPDCRGINLDFQQQFFDLQLPKYEDLPFGAIIGKVNIDFVLPTEKIKTGHVFNYGSSQRWKFTEQEIAFGDYGPNRYGWLLSDPKQFNEPIPVKGKLGIWEYDFVNF